MSREENGIALPRLMLVTDRARTRHRPLVDLVHEAVAGGVGLVQVREKDLAPAELEELVAQIRRAAGRRVRVIVNGNSLVARNAGGLHLAAAELPLPRHGWDEADWTYGRSIHDDAELDAALEEGVTYVVAGAIWPTPSKPGHPGLGLDRLHHLARRAAPTPLFAIGGVTVSRIPEAIHAGAWGVAVTGAILESSHPRNVAEAMSAALRVAAG